MPILFLYFNSLNLLVFCILKRHLQRFFTDDKMTMGEITHTNILLMGGNPLILMNDFVNL